MGKPVISVVIPCYNHGHFLDDAISSIKSAAKKYEYEVIIVNDGSTDVNTLDKLRQLESDGYYVLNQTNQGLASARNNGIAMANGEFILPLDSDNMLLEPYLNTAIDILIENPQYAVVYSKIQYFAENNSVWEPGPFNLQRLFLLSYIDACAVYRKKIWQAVGGYDEKMPVMGFEDWDFWLRVGCSGYQFYYLQELGYKYRYLNDSMSRQWTFEQNKISREYMEKKHSRYLGTEYVYDYVLSRFKAYRPAAFKIFILTYFPSVVRIAKKLKLIKTDSVF